MLGLGSLSPAIAEFLIAAVHGRLNMLITGGTGSGKTTLLNILSRYISDRERIVTIEDSAELMLQQPHVVRLRRARRTSRARARSRSATCSATACACARTAS
jgi:pilus assembly protein CpaF